MINTMEVGFLMEKKNILTYEGLKQLEDELQDLKVNRRKQVAEKIKEAREQGDQRSLGNQLIVLKQY